VALDPARPVVGSDQFADRRKAGGATGPGLIIVLDRDRRLHRHAGGHAARGPRPFAQERIGGGHRRRRGGILCHRGFQVTASTGRPQEADYLTSWARARSSKLAGPAKPLEKQCWAGAVDCVASTTLVNMLALTRYGGAVATCGLTGSIDLLTSVAPFILRGASLLGIESLMRPIADRRAAWGGVASELDREKLAAMTSEIGLAEAIEAARDIVEGRIRGRIMVKIG
jgi:acrylyl-CoA reductase (NADPH)